MSKVRHHAHIIKWRDSQSTRGWTGYNDKHEVAEITCVGWVVQSDKDKVVVTSHLCYNGDTHSPMAIPRECITSMKKLRFYVEKDS